MDSVIKELTEALEGSKNHIRRLLEVKGISTITINEIMRHIENMIAYSGNIGKVYEGSKSYKALLALNAKIDEQGKEISKLRTELKKYAKSL